jgi:hypothetical protein
MLLAVKCYNYPFNDIDIGNKNAIGGFLESMDECFVDQSS